jgi:hypothetical protein
MKTRIPLGLVLLLQIASATPAGASSEELYAMYDGELIALSKVASHHCHDGRYPEIRCFATEIERDRDAAAVARGGQSTPTGDTAGEASLETDLGLASSTYYVVFYEHANYGGASYMTAVAHSDLRAIGWNDVISSFKSLNAQRPKWWEHINYGGSTWQWTAGAWVSYVGDAANDRFSSVKNVP